MTSNKKILAGCLVPVSLIASCAGKMSYDSKMYNLPGEVLKSSSKPTQHLQSAMQVAETLDSYVQPRFEILRDKNFGVLRIIFKKHAGIVQLKVDSPREHELIANVNATKRLYAIGLLHSSPKPDGEAVSGSNKLQLLYFNQQVIATDQLYGVREYDPLLMSKIENQLNWDDIEKTAAANLPLLMSGDEVRSKNASWDILMRPVIARNQECLSCHTNEKLGATLGVMVYAVRSDMSKPAVRIGRLLGDLVESHLGSVP